MGRRVSSDDVACNLFEDFACWVNGPWPRCVCLGNVVVVRSVGYCNYFGNVSHWAIVIRPWGGFLPFAVVGFVERMAG